MTRTKTPVPAATVLTGLRRDLEAMIRRVDAALDGTDPEPEVRSPRPARRTPLPVDQTYPSGYDYRDDPEGLRQALSDLYARVVDVEDNLDLYDDDLSLHREMCLRAAEARMFQIQAAENSREWETAVGIIRSLTRLVSEEKPGFVYGLAANHNTDWGKKILDILSEYDPPTLPARA